MPAVAPSLAVHLKVPEATTDVSASSEAMATTDLTAAEAVTVEGATKIATPTTMIAQIGRVTAAMPIWATMMTLRHRQQT